MDDVNFALSSDGLGTWQEPNKAYENGYIPYCVHLWLFHANPVPYEMAIRFQSNVRGQRPPEARSAGGGPTAPRC